MTTETKQKATLSNHLNLEEKQMSKLSDNLNDLLADYHIFYQNVRGFHWNVRGNDFFILHEKFEELYTWLYQSIDELAERVLMIGYMPTHAYSDYLKRSIHKEITEVKNGDECVKQVIDGLGVLIASHRKITGLADDAGDIATADLLTKFVGDLEKRMWMFTMYRK